jgi:hypothetical protein
MMTVPVKQPAAGEILESVLMKGDLSKLTPEERTQYYMETCKSLGLNPLTKPFEYITLNGKLQLYALRACADQLRKINGISLEIISRDITDDVLTVHVRAKTPDGRVDEDLGSVPFPPTLKGEARSNAELKAVTKAKRRATLSICGLGLLDETEIDSLPASAKRPAAPAANVMLPPHDPNTGEVANDPAAPAVWEDYVARWHNILEDATDAKELGNLWNSTTAKRIRKEIDWPEGELEALMTHVGDRIAELKGTAPR